MPAHILPATSPTCEAPTHRRTRSWREGCRCPETLALQEAYRERVKRRNAARYARDEVVVPRLEPAVADRVLIERVLRWTETRTEIEGASIRFTALEYDVDRLGVIRELMGRGLPVGTVASRLNVSPGLVSALLAGKKSRARVAA
jgi:hypothetical protein